MREESSILEWKLDLLRPQLSGFIARLSACIGWIEWQRGGAWSREAGFGVESGRRGVKLSDTMAGLGVD